MLVAQLVQAYAHFCGKRWAAAGKTREDAQFCRRQISGDDNNDVNHYCHCSTCDIVAAAKVCGCGTKLLAASRQRWKALRTCPMVKGMAAVLPESVWWPRNMVTSQTT